jgi:hypothetical protein
MDKICANCKYWSYSGGEEGRCRRYPPVILQNLIDKIHMFESELLLKCNQPVSHETDSCGEWCHDSDKENGYPFNTGILE